MDNVQKNNGLKKTLILSIISAVAVLTLAAIISVGVIRLRTSNKLSKKDKNYYNEIVMLYNEALGKKYTYNEDNETNNDLFVSDVNPHLKAIGSLVFTTSFKYKEIETELAYDNAVVLTYYGMHSLKTDYTILYNVDADGKYVGVINVENKNEASFIGSLDDDGHIKTELTKDTQKYSVVLAENKYSVSKGETKLYSYDIKKDMLELANTSEYKIAASAGKLNISTKYDKEDVMASISLVSSNGVYSYEYTFANKVIIAQR